MTAWSFWRQFTLINVLVLIYVQLFVTPWIVARQAPLSMGLSRQEYKTG